MNVKLKSRVSKLLNNLSTRKFKKLTPSLLFKINDKTYYNLNNAKMKLNINRNIHEDPKLIEKQFKEIERDGKVPIKCLKIRSMIGESLKRKFENIPIINPNSIYKIIWDLV